MRENIYYFLLLHNAKHVKWIKTSWINGHKHCLWPWGIIPFWMVDLLLCLIIESVLLFLYTLSLLPFGSTLSQVLLHRLWVLYSVYLKKLFLFSYLDGCFFIVHPVRFLSSQLAWFFFLLRGNFLHKNIFLKKWWVNRSI